ncbi:MAG: bifunctional DNA-formamidopyrimidine glycosylase/DNA-(apurinic or apyrimidinic site) lyase [Pseudomonadota bacterium]
MPELPEVETTRRGIQPWIEGRVVEDVIVRNRALRWPVPRTLERSLRGQRIVAVERRAKYLLLRTDAGTAIVHLGMSGSLRIVDCGTPPEKHDHVDVIFEDGAVLRLRDPRRFGSFLWTARDPARHKLIADLGPEPLDELTPEHLYRKSRGRRAPLRNFLLDGRVVVGVGNIYANEAAHRAGIHPARAAGRVSEARYRKLVTEIRSVLQAAIAKGGTTLRDFASAEGSPGYFSIELEVYGREGDECRRCSDTIVRKAVGGRSMFYCPGCQK